MKSDPDAVGEARERFAAGFDDLRGNLHEELGWAPRGLRWIIPVVALAAGLAAGVVLKRNLPRLRGEAPSRRRLRR
ncbi:MAG: hypothetical protein ABIV06_07820 [Thermoanaerobaculia bacterium]